MKRCYGRLAAIGLATCVIFAPTASFAGVFVGAGIGIGIGISVKIAPPALPVLVQPPCVVADTIWTPGYWAYGNGGYYWVAGAWLAAPRHGYLWTPGYWGYTGGAYRWHAGYWGPHVGFYGGVNYGFGYGGVGYAGGAWSGEHFRYNTAVTHFDTTTINNYSIDKTVINENLNAATGRVSYNGGPGGIRRYPSAEEVAYRSEPHLAPTRDQQQHVAASTSERQLPASEAWSRFNHSPSANRDDAFHPTSVAHQSRTEPEDEAERPPMSGSRAAAPDRAPSSYHAAGVYRAVSAYRAPSAHRGANAYHAPRAASHAPAAAHAHTPHEHH